MKLTIHKAAKFIDDPSTRAIKNEADKLLEQTESEDNRP